MVHYLIICRSLTYAQRTARVLERVGISGHIMRTPKGIAAEGCGYCVKVQEQKLPQALIILQREGISPKRVYLQTGNGELQEVTQ